MRKLALTLSLALIVGGCTSESEVAQTTAPASANSKNVTAPAQARRLPTNRKNSFAAMPDRGTLLAYDQNQQPRHRGAQIYHSVQLSEAHAFKAAAPGKSIELPMPSGNTVRIDYVRHEEGLDGNWSWVGKTADGLDAVITFGESAVFGRIAQRDTEAVRLTTSAGRSWLVESDPSKMLDGNLGRDSDESDMLIPSSVVAAISAKKLSAAADDEAAPPSSTVDVALGFTNGLVTKYGTVANANTRLANLVAITNQGYANSIVTPRIRLVRTVQVSYTDTNSNETALEAVTGYTCTTSGCTAQTVPTELVPLRTARDTYGADLVSLVRPFQAPQHQGCGIAWLLGGGGFTIDSTDAPFGYSVISDGTDVDETDGRTYFCREETLAHELGHNMGQQHNIEDAGTPPDSGTHSYSYGYREATTTGFYTVMAYRLANSSQFSINYFGNPSVNYADTGRATGSATADNARSLNLSMPLVVQFRAAVVPFGLVPTLMTINKTGASGTTEVHALTPNAYTSFSQHIASALHTTGSDYKWEFLFGDYNKDGVKDLYAINRVGGSNTTEVHILNGANGYQSFLAHITTALHQTGTANDWVFRLGDYNQDGTLDLYVLARNGLSNTTEVHVLNGANNFNTFLAHIASALHATGSGENWAFEIGDWNQDNRPDIFVIAKNGGSNTTEIHVLDGASNYQSYSLHRATALGQTGSNSLWNFKIGDYNQDGVLDVYAIARQGLSGTTEIHILNGQSGFAGFLAHIASGLHSVPVDNSWDFELVD